MYMSLFVSTCIYLLSALLARIGQAVCARTQAKDDQRELRRI